MRSCILFSVLLAACAHRPLGMSVVVEPPTVKADPPTKLICASLTKEAMGESTLSSCKEWVQVSVYARGWDAWGEPIHQKLNPCDRYGYDSEQCREAVFAFAAMKVEEAHNRR